MKCKGFCERSGPVNGAMVERSAVGDTAEGAGASVLVEWGTCVFTTSGVNFGCLVGVGPTNSVVVGPVPQADRSVTSTTVSVGNRKPVLIWTYRRPRTTGTVLVRSSL